MTRLSRIVPVVLSLLLAVGAGAPAGAASDDPAAIVEAFHDQLLSAMRQADTEGVQKRFERLAPAVEKAFDLERMIRVATGPQWEAADPTQRAALLEAFRRLTIATYAAQFDGYAGERFELAGEQPGPQQTILVQTRLVGNQETDVALTYVMKETDSRWRIADILLDNAISQLAVRRSEYRRILADSGIAGLIDTLDGKTDDLLAG